MAAVLQRFAAVLCALSFAACSQGGGAADRAGEDGGLAATPAADDRRSEPSAPSVALPETPAATTSPSPPDAGTPSPVPLTAAVAIVDGQETPISREGGTLVDPAATFRIEVAAALTDGRLALHDGQDAMVASNGTTEIGTSWTRYRLTPVQPLQPGTDYALRVDGAMVREAHDPSGRAYAPVELKLKTNGERPAPPAKKKRGKRRS